MRPYTLYGPGKVKCERDLLPSGETQGERCGDKARGKRTAIEGLGRLRGEKVKAERYSRGTIRYVCSIPTRVTLTKLV